MKKVIILLFILMYTLASAIEVTAPTVSVVPEKNILNVGNGETTRFNLSIKAHDPGEIRRHIKNIRLTIMDKKTNQVEEKDFSDITEFNRYTFAPQGDSNFRISSKVTMESGISFDDSFPIKTIDKFEIDLFKAEERKYMPNGSVSVEITPPDLVFKALDLTFVIDNSESMRSRIKATQKAAGTIFQRLRDKVKNIRASVVTFSLFNVNKDNEVYSSIDYLLRIKPTSSPKEFGSIQIDTSRSGHEFQYFAMYKAAQEKTFWRDGALKLLVLMTDERDNAYCGYADDSSLSCEGCDFNRKLNWRGYGELSVTDILDYLGKNDFAAAALYEEHGEACYGDVMKARLKEKFAGIYKLPNGDLLQDKITDSLFDSMNKLIGNTFITMNPLDDSGLIQRIEPEAPLECIDAGKRSFKYSCLREKKSKMRFRIIFANKQLRENKFTLLLELRTDKNSIIGDIPVTLSK